MATPRMKHVEVPCLYAGNVNLIFSPWLVQSEHLEGESPNCHACTFSFFQLQSGWTAWSEMRFPCCATLIVAWLYKQARKCRKHDI